MKAKLYKTEKENYVLVDPTKGTYDDGYMLGTSRESQYNKLSIKNCETIERGYDLDELAKECAETAHTMDELYENGLFYGFVSGFKKALEIIGDKKFSEVNMEDAYYFGSKKLREEYLDFIKTFKKTEWDVEIEMKKVKDETKIVGAVKGVKGSGNKITTYKSVPKLDLDGCLILKR